MNHKNATYIYMNKNFKMSCIQNKTAIISSYRFVATHLIRSVEYSWVNNKHTGEEIDVQLCKCSEKRENSMYVLSGGKYIQILINVLKI